MQTGCPTIFGDSKNQSLVLNKFWFECFFSELFRLYDGYIEILKLKAYISYDRKRCFTHKLSMLKVIEKTSTLR